MRPEIALGDLRLTLAPECGGAIAGFWIDRPSGALALLRPMPPDASDAVQAGSFTMLPFANCIRDNRFSHAGRDWQVAPNMPGVRLNFHGSGWRLPWEVAQISAASAVLTLQADDGVWRYAARQVFTLDEDGLTVDVSVSNEGDEEMPFGIGLHPWFPRHGDGMIQFAAESLWSSTSDGEAVALEPVGPAMDFSNAKAPPHQSLNTCYTDWPGQARMIWPSEKVALTMIADATMGHLMVHIPADDTDTICLEPQSNAPCGFDGLAAGHCPTGVHILSPKQTLSGRMTIRVSTFPLENPTP